MDPHLTPNTNHTTPPQSGSSEQSLSDLNFSGDRQTAAAESSQIEEAIASAKSLPTPLESVSATRAKAVESLASELGLPRDASEGRVRLEKQFSALQRVVLSNLATVAEALKDPIQCPSGEISVCALEVGDISDFQRMVGGITRAKIIVARGFAGFLSDEWSVQIPQINASPAISKLEEAAGALDVGIRYSLKYNSGVAYETFGVPERYELQVSAKTSKR